MARELQPYEEEGACGLVANLAMCCNGGTLDDAVAELAPERKVLAYELARSALNHLTAGVVANCPVTVRPCKVSDMGFLPGWYWTGLSYVPRETVPWSWVGTCGCGIDCGCGPSPALDLVSPVAEIVEVKIDGVALEEGEYRLSEGRYLYRTDGTPWPQSQDMHLEPDSVGTFTVTYRPGWALGLAGESAYGRLACEFARAICGDGKCAFPKNVRSVVRSGVVIEIKDGLFPGGLTGMRDVDVFVASVNPGGLRSMPVVASPDSRRKALRGV